MENQLIAVVFGFAAACSWGAGDFSGALASRRSGVWAVVFWGQGAGAFILVALAMASGEAVPPAGQLGYGLLAGICGGAGLVALYTGLARGPMGIVAPLSAVITALVPILAGAVLQGLPGNLQLAGFFLAAAAVWLLAYNPADKGLGPMELGFSMAAGLGFGLFFLFISLAGRQSLFWPLVAARCGSISLVGVVLLYWGSGPAAVGLRGWGLVLALVAGICDAGGNGFFVSAAKLGRLDMAAVLGSLYPAVTVMLAWSVLKENLKLRQWIGVATTLAALVCIAYPGS